MTFLTCVPSIILSSVYIKQQERDPPPIYIHLDGVRWVYVKLQKSRETYSANATLQTIAGIGCYSDAVDLDLP